MGLLSAVPRSESRVSNDSVPTIKAYRALPFPKRLCALEENNPLLPQHFELPQPFLNQANLQTSFWMTNVCFK